MYKVDNRGLMPLLFFTFLYNFLHKDSKSDIVGIYEGGDIMKTVVITGSARGLGFEMAKEFRKHDYNVVISDILEEKLLESKNKLEEIEGKGEVLECLCDVTKEKIYKN